MDENLEKVKLADRKRQEIARRIKARLERQRRQELERIRMMNAFAIVSSLGMMTVIDFLLAYWGGDYLDAYFQQIKYIMGNFDLTPLVKSGGYKVIYRLFVWSVPLVLLLFTFGNHDFAVSFFRGVVIGLLDTVVMFHGMKQALPYVDTPRKGVKVMRRYRYYRLGIAGSIFVLMLRMKYPVFGASLGFLLIHIFLIINLLFFAYRLNNKKEA